jgi:hypothetical protein
MKNTLENKARFFAQYWGIGLLWHTQMENQYADIADLIKRRNEVNEVFHGNPDPELTFWQLPLRPLSSITDEEAIDCAFIAVNTSGYLCKSRSQYLKIERIEQVIKVHIEGVIVEILTGIGLIAVLRNDNSFVGYLPTAFEPYQHLQSIAIALPYHNLSVEQLIEYGWVKLN